MTKYNIYPRPRHREQNAFCFAWRSILFMAARTVLVILIGFSVAIFAAETKIIKDPTPQDAAPTDISHRGANGVDTGATSNPVAPVNIQNTIPSTESNKLTKSSSKITTAVNNGIPFADNDQIRVILSSRDINRVMITGDKIQAINGPTGLYTAKNDSWGSAYISIYGEKPLTIFLTTTQGHNCSLLVTPQAVPGKTVILEPTTPVLFPKSSVVTDSYQKALIDLISNMINFEPSEDYEYFSIKDAQKRRWIENIKKTNFYNVAYVTPVVFYRGEKLSGIISRVSSRIKGYLTLQPSYFYQPGVKAAALSQQTIPPSGSCWLYQIIDQH